MNAKRLHDIASRFQVPRGLAEALPRSAVYAYLITECLELFEHSVKDIEKHWSISADEAYSLGIRSVPTLIGNLLIASQCVERFGPDLLATVPGFYHFNRIGSVCMCNEFSDVCVCDLPCWRLDIDTCWARHGLIIPQRNGQRWFSSLKVFRHAEDSRPFTLKVREATPA
ncbi:MAG: hypothetical protein ABJB97_11150 [Acidobacteriota bacterium]